MRRWCWREEAIDAVIELEHMGLPFDRTEDGRISQRRFGGHTSNFGGKPVRRACHAADRTGHMILQTLYQQCIKNNVTFFDEYHVVDLIRNGDKVAGVVAMHIDTRRTARFPQQSGAVRHGRLGPRVGDYQQRPRLTGDGTSIAYRRGVPLQDMEFFQFHPTGIYQMGILITEGVRGEGGVLLNDRGERFMERYAPKIKDLASRDVVSRAIYLEIEAGRGIKGKRYVHLDVTPGNGQPLSGRSRRDAPDRRATTSRPSCPIFCDFCRTYLGVDPVKEPMPDPADGALCDGRHSYRSGRAGR